MKAKLGCILFGLIAVLSLSAGEGDAKKKETAKFQGTWNVESILHNGEQHKLKFKMVFKDNEGKIEGNEEVSNEYGKIKFTLDPAAKPKAIDLTVIAGSQTDFALEGIYELKDDELRICTKLGKGRPTEFAAPDGSNCVLLVLKKAP